MFATVSPAGVPAAADDRGMGIVHGVRTAGPPILTLATTVFSSTTSSPGRQAATGPSTGPRRPGTGGGGERVARHREGRASCKAPTASRLSLARGARGAAPCTAPIGRGVGGPRADRGSGAPAAGAVAPRLVLPDPRSPGDFPPPPLRATELQATANLRPAPSASAGTRQGVPAAHAHATTATKEQR
jgi:hypothetical protein